MRFWFTKAVEAGARWRGSNFGVLERNLGLLVEEEDFFRPSEKTNGEAKEGDCNMSQRDDERGRGEEGGAGRTETG